MRFRPWSMVLPWISKSLHSPQSSSQHRVPMTPFSPPPAYGRLLKPYHWALNSLADFGLSIFHICAPSPQILLGSPHPASQATLLAIPLGSRLLLPPAPLPHFPTEYHLVPGSLCSPFCSPGHPQIHQPVSPHALSTTTVQLFSASLASWVLPSLPLPSA